MEIYINVADDHLGRFVLDGSRTYRAVVLVESTPERVYAAHTAIVGKPTKSDSSYRDFRDPLWNAWAEFYRTATEGQMLTYVEGLAANRLSGHAVQVDAGWERHRGDFAFDPARFPTPRAMSDRIHRLGFDLGVWVSFYIETTSRNYAVAKRAGYLLADRFDPTRPCLIFTDWAPNGAGLVDIADRKAAAWLQNKLHALMSADRIDGLKFDFPGVPTQCALRAGYDALDYLTLQAKFAGRFDLQGVGFRAGWGSQRFGLAVREADKPDTWQGLQAAVAQGLAISTLGYPFVETDTVGGSLGADGGLASQPPSAELLVRWAEAASLMPLMYSSVSPVGTVVNPMTGRAITYDARTVRLYRAAIGQHMRVGAYIWSQVRASVHDGRPIMKPLFFDFPGEQETYKLTDEWLLGDALLAAPVLEQGTSRDIYLPTGRWWDVDRRTVVRGPTTLRAYAAPLGVTPAFVRLGLGDQTHDVLQAFTVTR
jgi:alpha-glucosidase (family GH31 glycosyl hydrolase)